MNANRFEVLGINDDRDTCECCGRSGLKRVVWIRDREADTVRHFGTTCALKPAKGFGLDAEIREAIRGADAFRKQCCEYAHHLYRRAGGKYVAVKPHEWEVQDREAFERARAEAARFLRGS